jgi:RNA polymerase sigma-70 factor (ECF subfamily)
VASPAAGLDERLLEHARTYDLDALAAIYDSYEARIFSYIFHRVGDANVAQDLTAQVFLHMLEAIQNEHAWRSSFSGWLYRIAHNLVVDFYRGRGRSSQVSFEDVPMLVASTDDPQRAAERNLMAEGLRAAINRLTEEQAQVVTLRFLEGLSIADVATATGKTEGAVKALQYRAVLSLRRLLEQQA